MEYKIQSFLERIGLSKNEVKIYGAALRLGVCSAAELSKASRVHRVASYAVIDNLIKKGLLMQSGAGQKKMFTPRHPRQIKTLIADQKRQVRKLELRYEEILPQMQIMYDKAGFKPRITYYEGEQELRQMNHEINHAFTGLPTNERIMYSYTNPNLLMESFDETWEDDLNERIDNEIAIKVIIPDGPASRELVEKNEEALRETALLPADQFPFKNDITIYGNKIAIQALDEEQIGVVIESEEIAHDQKLIFSLAWAGAKAIEAAQQK